MVVALPSASPAQRRRALDLAGESGLAVLTVPVLVQNMGWGDYARAVQWQGWFIIVALPVTLAITFAFTPEPPPGPPAEATERFAYLKLYFRLICIR